MAMISDFEPFPRKSEAHTIRELLVIENVPQKNIAPITITFG